MNIEAISNCVYKKTRHLNMEGSVVEPQSPSLFSDTTTLVEGKQPPPSSGRQIHAQSTGANKSPLGLSFCAGESRGRRRKAVAACKVIAAARGWEKAARASPEMEHPLLPG